MTIKGNLLPTPIGKRFLVENFVPPKWLKKWQFGGQGPNINFCIANPQKEHDAQKRVIWRNALSNPYRRYG